ncbi:MAG: DUF2070 family protein [Nitrososphaerota archaeon]
MFPYLSDIQDLKYVNATSRLASLYPYIKGLPGRGNLLKLLVLEVALIALFTTLIDKAITFSLALCFYMIIIVNYLFHRIGRELVNFRRLNGLMIIEMSLIFLGLLFFYLLDLTLGYRKLGLAMLSSMISFGVLLRGLIVRTLAGDDVKSTITYTLSISFLEIFPFIYTVHKDLGYAVIIGQVIGNVSHHIYSIFINSRLKIRGLKPIELLSAILMVFLEGRKEHLENLAEKLDTKAEIKIDVLMFNPMDKSDKIALVVPTFHPGPFRDFGSTILPYIIEEKFSKIGVKTVFVRGLSDHSRNIISRMDCEYISDTLLRTFENYDGRCSSMAGDFRIVKKDSVSAYLLPIGKTTIAILTLHPKGMEDIPPEVMEGIYREDLVVIDAHNSFSENVKELDGDKFKNIRELLYIISNTNVDRSSNIIKAGYGESRIEGYSIEDGVGPQGIRAILLDNGKEEFALIVIDSNNAIPIVRERILHEVGRLGVRYCEVVTTDTHIVNGVKLGGRGYHPIGELIPVEAIIPPVLRAVEQARRNLTRVEVSRITLTFNNVKVMAKDFLEEAEKKTFKALTYLEICMVLTFIASLVLTLITF